MLSVWSQTYSVSTSWGLAGNVNSWGFILDLPDQKLWRWSPVICFNKSCRRFWFRLKFKNHCCRIFEPRRLALALGHQELRCFFSVTDTSLHYSITTHHLWKKRRKKRTGKRKETPQRYLQWPGRNKWVMASCYPSWKNRNFACKKIHSTVSKADFL